MIICAAAISVAPLGSEKAKLNACDDPLPELGVTETGAGTPPALAAVTVSDALLLCDSAPVVPVTLMVNDPVPPLEEV